MYCRQRQYRNEHTLHYLSLFCRNKLRIIVDHLLAGQYKCVCHAVDVGAALAQKHKKKPETNLQDESLSDWTSFSWSDISWYTRFCFFWPRPIPRQRWKQRTRHMIASRRRSDRWSVIAMKVMFCRAGVKHASPLSMYVCMYVCSFL